MSIKYLTTNTPLIYHTIAFNLPFDCRAYVTDIVTESNENSDFNMYDDKYIGNIRNDELKVYLDKLENDYIYKYGNPIIKLPSGIVCIMGTKRIYTLDEYSLELFYDNINDNNHKKNTQGYIIIDKDNIAIGFWESNKYNEYMNQNKLYIIYNNNKYFIDNLSKEWINKYNNPIVTIPGGIICKHDNEYIYILRDYNMKLFYQELPDDDNYIESGDGYIILDNDNFNIGFWEKNEHLYNDYFDQFDKKYMILRIFAN